MTGAVATMALFPQMAVPTATNVPSRDGRPSSRLIRLTPSSAVAIDAATIGSATTPIDPTVVRLSRKPNNATPMRSTRCRHSRRPGWYDSGSPMALRESNLENLRADNDVNPELETLKKKLQKDG